MYTLNSNSTFFSKGVKHMLLSTFWFSLMNVMVKKLAHLPAMELVFFRCSVATLIGFAGLYKECVSWVGSNRKLLFLRGLFGTTALYMFFLSIQNMPLGTAVTIQYISPVFTTILAIYLLKEKVMPVQWLFFLLSFVGVILIKGFDDRVSWTMLAVGILSSFFSALAYTMVRSLKQLEHPLVVVLHFQLLGALVGGVFTIFNFKMPQGIDWLYIVLIGIVTQLGQLNLTRSLHSENIAKVSILNYLGIIYALFFGWAFFKEIHDGYTFLGMLCVIAGVVLNIYVTTRKKEVIA